MNLARGSPLSGKNANPTSVDDGLVSPAHVRVAEQGSAVLTASGNRQVALVTGSSRGIGLAAAKALARDGFAVAMNGPSDDAELRAAVAEVSAIGPCVAAPFDVTESASHTAALAAIEVALGPLTTLVNNAGVGVLSRGDILDVSEASWDRCLTVNAKAMFFLSQAFVRRLLARERAALFHAIINVTSANATAVAVQRAEYCASKAAAAMVSKALAVRLGSENIAVYDVQPGLIATEMTAPVIELYRTRAEAGLTLFPRVGQPEEMGAIIAALATGKLPYTTGQVISADAGMLVSRF
jgi:3-oxoacyl-[acyl-carrier protein] reductase